ncbi:AAA family ATPase [Nocardia sp. NPDC048505]|uniref:AAA family ATPase n=1 Tax=unclassified Nocardia TaxID=2637762 RepID=UPI0033C05202
MDKLLVLVNGLPGAGKTTLGTGLARSLNAWFLSKDVIKEALAGCLENAVETPDLGGVAMDTIWALAARAPADVVIDSWWFKPRDLAFARAGIAGAGARRTLEVWCDLPAATARSRYAARQRAPIHRDRQRLAEHWDEWAAHAAPLGLAPVLVVDTTGPIDHGALAERIQAMASPPH